MNTAIVYFLLFVLLLGLGLVIVLLLRKKEGGGDQKIDAVTERLIQQSEKLTQLAQQNSELRQELDRKLSETHRTSQDQFGQNAKIMQGISSQSAKLIADLITTAGANRVLSMDLHAGQIQGFFNIPVDNLFATPVLLEYIKKRFQEDTVIVSPDTGGVERARAFGKRLGATLAIVDKRREGPNEAQVMNIIGDIKNKKVIILDDLIDTAGTVVQAANALKEAGAVDVSVCATHPVLSGPAIERLENSDIKEVIVTDTIPLHEQAQICKRIKVLSVSGLLSEAVRRIYYNDSVSSLFI